MKKILPFVAMGAISISTMNVQAGIFTLGTDIEFVGSSAGLNLAEGQIESDTKIRVYSEQLNYTLTTNINVDDTSIGSIGNSVPGTISTGTVVDSYLVHFDKVGNDSTPVSLGGNVLSDLGVEILGIIFSASGLNASDSELGLAASYETSSNRGLEFTNNQDSYGLGKIGGILRNLALNDLEVSTNIDEIRVITAAAAPVPVPAAVWLLGSALLGLTGISRRKKS